MAAARTGALSAVQKLGLAASGFLLTFLILEASLRLAGFALLSLQAHRNAASLRQKGVYRIMCIGESTTRGQYPQFLEEALNERDVGIRFSVIDRGMVGVQSSALLSRLESDLDLYRPNLVVAMMGINDRSVRYYADIPSSEGFLFRHLRAYRLACLLWRDTRRRWAERRGPAVSASRPLPPGPLDDGWRATPGDQARASRGPVKTPDGAVEHVLRGWSYSDRGDYAQAVAQFKKASELNPHNSEGYEGLGESYSSLGQFKAAESVMLEGVSRNPRAVPLYVALGRLYLRQARFRDGEKWFSKALELHPDVAVDNVYYGLGEAYLGQRDFDKALMFFGKALEANPANKRAIEGVLWSAYFAHGDLSRLRALLEEIRRKDLALDDRIYAGLATAYSRLGEPALARQARDRAEELRLELYNPILAKNYRRLKEILDRRGIRLACAQYPMRSLAPLQRMMRGHEEGLIFIDNQRVFQDAVERSSFETYFADLFGGDFGHCTPKGNKLLARNIAGVLLKEGLGSIPPSSVAVHIERAEMLLKLGRRDAALAALRRAESSGPKDPDLERMLGMYRGLKELDRALAMADSIIKLRPDDAPVHIERAEMLLRLGRRDAALASLKRAESIGPRDSDLDRMLEMYRGLKEPDRALALADRIIQLRPDDAPVHIERAEMLLKLGRRDAALASLKRAESIGPRDSDLDRMLGMYRGLKEPDRVLAMADRVIKLRPGDAPLRIERAEMLLKLGRREEALAALRQEESIGPRDSDLERMLVMYRGLKELDRALAVADRIIQLRPGEARPHIERAEVLLELGSREEALAALRRAEDIGPSYSDLERMLRMYRGLKELDRALAMADRIIQLRPGEAPLRIERAEVLLELGGREEALAALRRAQSSGPSYSDLERMLGLYRGLKELDRALATVDRVIKLRPGEARPHIERAEILLELGRRDEALPSLRRAESIGPEDSDLGRMLGLYRGLGELDRALVAADRLIQLRPGDAPLHIERAEMLLKLGRRDEALASLRRAESSGPKDPDLRRMLGLYRGLKKLDRALVVADRLIKLRPGDAPLHIERAKMLLELGRRDEALASLQRAERLGPPAENLRQIARDYQSLGECAQALRLWTRLIDSSGSQAKDYSDKAICEYRSGDEGGAISDLERAIQLSPGELEAYLSLGTLYSGRGQNDQALGVYERALAIKPLSATRPIRRQILDAAAALRHKMK